MDWWTTQTSIPQGLRVRFGALLQSKSFPKIKRGRGARIPQGPVAFYALPDLAAELQRLTTRGVISPVNHAEFAAPIVVVRKNKGTIRLCADFSTGLNYALMQHHYPLPEDISAKLNGGRLFS